MLLLGLVGIAGCGEHDSSGEVVAVRIDQLKVGEGDDLPAVVANPPGGPTPYETPSDVPSYEPEELDRTELDANLAALPPADRALVDHYLRAPLGEGSWVMAAPMTVEEAKARLLGPNPEPASRRDVPSATSSSYVFLQVGDGVVAYEDTGFADPPGRLLAALSRDGGAAAVATENIEAMTRFGYARDGKVVFDAFEYAFVEDLEEIPAEVRDLARLAWVDLDGPFVETADWFAVAMAMSEKVTGVRAAPAVQDVTDAYVVPLPWAGTSDG